MPTEIISRPIIDRIIRNIYSIKEELERVELEPSRAANNIPVYIVCRERLRMVREDFRELRRALHIEEQLTAMGVTE